MSKAISLGKIAIKNFKSLYDVSFEPGNVNVFIGANGSGKSSILEAIGILSAAMSDRVNNNALQRKGIRLSTSALYKSKFSSLKMEGAIEVLPRQIIKWDIMPYLNSWQRKNM